MSEPIAKHQLFEYEENEPFLVLKAKSFPPGDAQAQVQAQMEGGMLFNHWHEELEVAYILEGKSLHYIDGVCVEGIPGRLVVTNSESAHNIIEDNSTITRRCTAAVVVLIHRRFLQEHFPQYESIYFTNEKRQARPEIREIILQLVKYAEREVHTGHDALYGKGLILQLLYYMCEEGTAKRGELNVNEQKNIERLKGVLTYIENHYTERLTQGEVASRFYFSKEYFSRYFKKCMGMTFTEYLIRYRLQRAKHDLLESERRVTDIALENGFSDDRRFINSFRKYYGTTPLQYRKHAKKHA